MANKVTKVDQTTFLRLWAGNSMIPALMVWGMRRGSFSPDGAPMSMLEVAEQTGYSATQVYEMCRLVDSMAVNETDNETAS